MRRNNFQRIHVYILIEFKFIKKRKKGLIYLFIFKFNKINIFLNCFFHLSTNENNFNIKYNLKTE